MKRAIFPILALALAMPAAVMAQDADAEDRIDEAMARAEAAGVPIELQRLKQAEGEAKGVPLDRIADVMEERADALIAAREAMPGSDADAIAAGADAVQEGIGQDVLEQIENTVPAERRFIATYVLSRLVDLGRAPAEALAQVEGALARGPDALDDLAAGDDDARERRGPPVDFGPAGFDAGAFGAGAIPSIGGPPVGIPGPSGQGGGPPGEVPFGGDILGGGGS